MNHSSVNHSSVNHSSVNHSSVNHGSVNHGSGSPGQNGDSFRKTTETVEGTGRAEDWVGYEVVLKGGMSFYGTRRLVQQDYYGQAVRVVHDLGLCPELSVLTW